MGVDLGPSPAGLKANIWIRYAVNLSRNTKLCELYDAGTTSSSSSRWISSSSSGEAITR